MVDKATGRFLLAVFLDDAGLGKVERQEIGDIPSIYFALVEGNCCLVGYPKSGRFVARRAGSI